MPSGLVNVSNVLAAGEYKQTFSYYNEGGAYNPTTGKWESTSQDPVEAFGSIQPVPRDDLRNLLSWQEGGARILSAILIYTQADLVPAENGQPDSATGSVVLHNALLWKVIEIDDYSAHGHKECIAVRIDNQGDS